MSIRKSMLARAAVTLAVLAGLSGIARAGELAVAALPDGRLQLFVVSQGQLLTAWKRTQNPGSQWTPLAAFDPPPGGTVRDVTVGELPDGRLQLFVTGSNGLITAWKRTPHPEAGWSRWSPFEASPANPPPDDSATNSRDNI